MRAFVRARALDQPERRIALAAGSPGIAMSLDLEAYDKRRAAMLALLKVAAGAAPFAAWVPIGEAIGRSKSEKLELYLKVLYELLRDILLLHEGAGEIRNQDIRRELEALAAKVQFAWIRKAVTRVDEIADADPAEHSEDDRAGRADPGTAAPASLYSLLTRFAPACSRTRGSSPMPRPRLRSRSRHRRAAPPRRTPWRCGDRRSCRIRPRGTSGGRESPCRRAALPPPRRGGADSRRRCECGPSP